MKKILVFALTSVSAMVLSASTLYWQVDNTAKEVKGVGNSTIAYLYAVEGGKHNVGAWANGPLGQLDYADFDDPNFPAFGNVTGYDNSSYAFFVELRNGNTRVAASEVVSYSDIKSYIYNGGMSQANVYDLFTGFTSEVVPEPTSGMLVMLGALVLGLRRKREIV